jgi:hypothetical protein
LRARDFQIRTACQRTFLSSRPPNSSGEGRTIYQTIYSTQDNFQIFFDAVLIVKRPFCAKFENFNRERTRIAVNFLMQRRKER